MPIRSQILGLLLCLGGLSAAPTAERIDFYYGIAEGNYLIGDLGGAERGIEQMLRINPDHIPALTLKARVLLDARQAEAALEAADRAIELAPENLQHTLLKALILGHMQRREEAGTLIEQVLSAAASGSDDARAARQLRGLLLMAEGEWDQAADAFNEIYLADPETAGTSLQLRSEAYLEKARDAMTGGDADAALAAIDEAIAVYQDQSGQESLQKRTALRLMRARLLTRIGRFEAAIQDLQSLTGQQPENYEALITLASLYASVERWDSLEALIEPIAGRPELADVALYLEGRAALAKNRVGTARAKFEAAIEALPKEADLLRRSLFFYRGICLELLGREDEAEVEILNALDAGFRPETSAEALTASRTLLRADRAADAIPLLEAVTLNRIEPGAEVWAMLGRAHLATDTLVLALSAFNESLRIEPNQTDARALRGSLLRKIGDSEGALADFKVALRLSPENHAIRYAQGLTALQLGRIEDAEASIGRTAAALQDQAGLHLLHAVLAYAIGDHEGAGASLDRYQSIIPEKQNPSAVYLAFLLPEEKSDDLGKDAVCRYFLGEFDRKEALDHAGVAESPEQARQQICAAAFWMAQWEHAQDELEKSRELLKISIQAGQPNFTEYQLARWQWDREP